MVRLRQARDKVLLTRRREKGVDGLTGEKGMGVDRQRVIGVNRYFLASSGEGGIRTRGEV